MSTGLPDHVESVLPLTPAQSGILFHCIASQGAGPYIGVVTADIEGPLDPEAFRAAFLAAVMATDALRASFVWEGVKRPLQVIHKSILLHWDAQDWSVLSPKEVERQTRVLVERYHEDGFDLTKAPLMRLTLARLGPETTRMIWAVHHIISDGWSTRSVLDEVLARCNGDAAPRPRTLFRDYLGWLKARDGSADEAFWRGYLKGFSAPTRIETRVAPETVRPAPHRHLEREIGADVLKRSEALCRDLRITQSTLMSTVWALILRRYARSDDIVFGATTAVRPVELPGADRAAGAFLNTLPVRFQIDPMASLSDTLRAAEAANRKRRAFEASGLADVQLWSELPAGTAIFDYVFAFERLPAVREATGPLRITSLETVQTSNYPLTFLVTPSEQLRLEIYHDLAVFSDAVAQAMLSEFEGLLKAVLDGPNQSIRDLASALPGLPAPVPLARPARLVLEAIAEAAAAGPDAPALSDAHRTLSYRELMDEVTRIAEMLAAAGVERGDIIPVALPRGVAAVTAFLGVLAAGAAYVPLDIAYPQERIAQVLERVAPKLVLTASEVPTYGPTPRLLIDAIDAKRTPVASPPSGNDLAYVIFTSGSQGRPKGVPITHAALAHSTAVRETVYGGPPESFLLLSSLAFDSSVVGLYWTLTTGGHLVVGDTDLVQDPGRLAAVVAGKGVRTMLCLPRLYLALLNAGRARPLECLRTVIVAGEAVPASLLESHAARAGDTRLFNEYGPTEATVWCTAAQLTDSPAGAEVPIGPPIPGVTVAVCDPDGRPLPDGVLGEIVVAGPTVAQPYLGTTEDSAGPFRSGTTGLRSYATGDLGLRSGTGAIYFLGRQDQQVKIRGHRIELSEIEHLSSRVAAPAEVCAVVFDQANGPAIALCVETGYDPDLELALHSAFDAELPGFARPAQLRFMPVFPQLPNGKIDLQSLTAEVQAAPAQAAPGAPPQGDTERRLAQIWCDVLGQETVTREADFFELGGDSLLSIGLFAKAEQAGLPIQPTDVFEHPTLQSLSAALVRRSAEEGRIVQDVSPLQIGNPDGSNPPVFLLHGNMWIFRQLVRGLGPRWPVGLQFSHHFHGSQITLGTGIEGFAEEALRAVRTLRPEGPYILCGYSAGAMITLELAQLLRQKGEEVPMLCLIDPPYDSRTNPGRDARDLAMQGASLARGMAARMMERLSHDGENHRQRVVSQAYAIAMRRYRMTPYVGAAYVLLNDENPAMAPGSPLARALPGAEIEVLPYHHKALLSDDEARLSLTSRLVARIKGL